MAKATERRWFWVTRKDAVDELPTWLALDVLRYDGARVLANPPDGFYLFESEFAPNLERLQSYGVKPAWWTTTATSYDRARFDIDRVLAERAGFPVRG